jgi:hypothetical protein
MLNRTLTVCAIAGSCFLVATTAFSQPSKPANEPRFRKQVLDADIKIGYGLAIGDVDGDRKPDILLADKSQIAWYRNGDWKKFVIAENLTESDNVCIAAKDLTGDGRVEIAVGAQWNPNETSDAEKSGAVFYLRAPADVTTKWQPVKLQHEPTVHRMKWMQGPDRKHYLVVAPLHGRGNKQGEGKGARLLAHHFTPGSTENWPVTILDSTLHLTHNFSILGPEHSNSPSVIIASKEGLRKVAIAEAFTTQQAAAKSSTTARPLQGAEFGAGEISPGKNNGRISFLATIEPMHGTSVVIYDNYGGRLKRQVLDSSLKEGHALGTADFMNLQNDQVVAGWRQPDRNGLTGLKLFVRKNIADPWRSYWIDEGSVAVEDLQVADLDGDGKPDIIASGRATHNVVIFWNESK